MALNGQDAKTLVADYDMDDQHLVYSTSELMTHFVQGARDVALLYGRNGEDGETVLRYSSQPTVQVVSGTVSSTYDAATGDLRLDYTHNGLAEVQIKWRRPSAPDPAARGQHDGGQLLAPGHQRRSGARAGARARADGDDRRSGPQAHRRYQRRDDDGRGPRATCDR